MDIRALGDGVFASPQIQPQDVAALKTRGVGLIVNNRPEGEAPDQPPGAAIAQACATAGVDYVALPVSGSPDAATVDAVRQALADRQGDALMFCRSGMRSTAAWALGAAKAGDLAPDQIRERAAAAGYDLSRLPL